jgi:hypothetical protein
MVGQGDLPVFKLRGPWRFRGTNLDAWIDAKTRRVGGEEKSK